MIIPYPSCNKYCITDEYILQITNYNSFTLPENSLSQTTSVNLRFETTTTGSFIVQTNDHNPASLYEHCNISDGKKFGHVFAKNLYKFIHK